MTAIYNMDHFNAIKRLVNAYFQTADFDTFISSQQPPYYSCDLDDDFRGAAWNFSDDEDDAQCFAVGA